MDTTDVFDDTFPTGDPGVGAYGTSPDIGPRGAAKRASLAWLGAFATACDLANQTYDRLVTRGAEAQQDFQRRAEDTRRQNAGARDRAQDFARTGMNVFLDTINVPNKADVDTINVKLNILTRKIDDLQTRESTDMGMATAAPVEMPPIVDPDGETAI